MDTHESYALAEQAVRLSEAARRRRAHHLAVARRQTRRAERAALQARLVLARAL